MDNVGAIGCCDGQTHAFEIVLYADNTAVPAHINLWRLCNRIEQKPLCIILLQIDECWPLMAFLAKQIKTVNRRVAKEHFANIPRYALRHHGVTHAQAIPDF